MRDTRMRCHCGARYNGSDHCSECYAEQYEVNSCGCVENQMEVK